MPTLNRAPNERELQKLIAIFLKAETDIINEIDSFCHIGLGRVSKYAFTMDVPLHTDIPVAARIGLVQQRTGEDTGVDA